jgi:photosystem II stability/assembly factor-like uncharacterized protein
MQARLASLVLCAIAAPLVAQTVTPALFNKLTWRNIGPFRAGRTVAVGGVGGSSPVFYIGSVDGGVWISPDAGNVWRPLFDHELVQSIGAIDVSQSDPNVIWVGTGETDIRSDLSSGDGVYKSSDGGKTWQNTGLKDTRQIARVVIDPRDNDTVYVGALGYAYGNNPDRGVYKTTDGGVTWTKVLYVSDSVGAADLALVPDHPDTLYACMWDAHRAPWSQYGPTLGPGSGLYRSTNGGKTWTQLQGHGLPEGKWGRSGITVSNDGRRVYALIMARRAGLYVSDDGGDTWVLRNADPRLTGRDWYFSRITIDPSDPDTFYVPNTAFFRSSDAGKTLTIVRAAPGGDDYHQLWIDPKNSSRMILGSDHGATISIDKGATWTTWYNQPTGQMYHVVTDNQFPYVVYGSQQDDGALGILSRTDHESISTRDWFIAGQPESGYVALDPLHPGIRYISSSYGGVVRVDAKTSLSTEINPWPAPAFGGDISQRKYRATWTPVLVMSQADRRSLYLGTQYVLKTVDGGNHWTQISPDLTGAKKEAMKKLPMPAGGGGFASEGSIGPEDPDPPTVANSIERGYGTIFTIAPSPREANLIWTGSDTGLVYLTRDGGKTWTNVTPPDVKPWSKISIIEASRFDSGTAYVAVDRHRLDDRTPYAYRTRDYGKTWTPITSGISDPNYVYAVREDSKQKGLLFAGTDFGIDVSFDDGDHWQPLQLNLPAVSVRDIDVHGDDLVIATHGRAFWIMDDITPLRQVAAAKAKQGPFFYQPATAIRVDHDPFPSTRIPVDDPTASNPAEGAVLDYYLPTTVRTVSLKIYDAKGRTVREFSSTKPAPETERAPAVAEAWRIHAAPLSGEPGMHRFVWGLTWSSTGEMDPDFPDAGGATAAAPRLPKVAPGQYKLVLTVDGTSVARMLTVVMDPRSTATQLALDEQQELGVSIYNDLYKTEAALNEIHAMSVRARLRAVSRQGGTQNGRVQEDSSAQAQPSELTRILNGDPKVPGSVGLTRLETELVSDLSAARSGYNAPTAQERELYLQIHGSVNKCLAEWAAYRQHSGLAPEEVGARK